MKPWTYEDYMVLVRAFPEEFSPEFPGWLRDNLAIWRRFQAEAFKVIERGRDHYSASTIVEFLRHYTLMSEPVGSLFKINDHAGVDMARLWRLCYPEHQDLFKYRRRTATMRAPRPDFTLEACRP